VFCHVFHGVGSTIIGEDHKVLPEIQEARHRGVQFDAANGRAHFAYRTARAALAEGFLPDVISTDLSTLTVFREPVIGLPFVMSKYLNMGLDLIHVVKACTSAPACLLGMEDQVGTLSNGVCADVTVLRLKQKQMVFADAAGEMMVGSQVLVPQLTICDGNILFRQMDL
jgi:predicted amidohydrolase